MPVSNLSEFDPSKGLNRGAGRVKEALWILVRIVFFQSAFPWPRGWKRSLLRLFGAKVGTGVVIKPRVTIHFPWKLIVGDYSWIGEEVFILNFEPCQIGAHCCISQRAFLCGGNHDYRASDFAYRNGPITLEEGVWVGAQCFVGPRVTVGANTVVTVNSVVTQSLPCGKVCGGNPCSVIRDR